MANQANLRCNAFFNCVGHQLKRAWLTPSIDLLESVLKTWRKPQGVRVYLGDSTGKPNAIQTTVYCSHPASYLDGQEVSGVRVHVFRQRLVTSAIFTPDLTSLVSRGMMRMSQGWN